MSSVKVVKINIQNRAAVVGFSVLIVAIGVILVTFGMALIAALAVTGTVVGAAATIFRRLRGKPEVQPGQRLSSDSGLDPALEVQPARPTVIEAPKASDK